MPIKTSIPSQFTQKDAIYRYLSDEFDIEKRFDSEKKAFPTSEMIEKGEWVRSEILESDTALWFFVFLAIGKIEAAEYLSDCCDRNVGITAKGDLQEDMSVLIVGIGAILKDPICLEIVARTGTIRQVLGEKLETDAYKVAQIISNNANDFAQFKKEGKQIYLKDVFGYAKSLEADIAAYTDFSYILNMAESDFRYFLAQTEIEIIDEPTALMGDSHAPDSCCMIM